MSDVKDLMKKFEELQSKLEEHQRGMTSDASATKAIEKFRKDNEEWQRKIETQIEAGGGVRVPGYADDKDSKKFSILRASVAEARRDWSRAPLEKAVLDQHEKAREALPKEERVMSIGVDSAGGFLVPVEQMSELIEFLYAQSVVMRAGATVLEGLRGDPVQIPKHTGSSSPSEVAENAAIGYDDLSVGQISLSPKKLGRGVKMSRETAQLAIPSVEALARMDLMRKHALVEDIRALRGSGASGQPLGVANVSGIGSVALGTNGGPISYDIFPDLEYELAVDDALLEGGRYAWIMHPRSKRNARKLKDGFGRPLFDFEANGQNRAQSAIGYPCLDSTQLPINLTKGSGTDLSEIYFGNWSELLIGHWGELRIEASIEAGDANGSAFTNDQLWIKAVRLYDLAVRHAESFALINDVA